MPSIRPTPQQTALIREHDNCLAQLQPLQAADSDLSAICRQTTALNHEVAHRRASKQDMANQCSVLHERIRRNENPTFLHFFVCNREAKVVRLKGELRETKQVEMDNSRALQDRERELGEVMNRQNQARNLVQTKRGWEERKEKLFEEVIGLIQPQPAVLQELGMRLRQQNAAIAETSGVSSAVGRCVAEARAGISELETARKKLKEAKELIEKEEETKRKMEDTKRKIEREEKLQRIGGSPNRRNSSRNSHGPKFNNNSNFASNFSSNTNSSEDLNRFRREYSNLESEKRRTVSDRESLIRDAKSRAENAYQSHMIHALRNLPLEARARYPQLCQKIGKAEWPDLRTSMFNNFGPGDCESSLRKNLAAVNEYLDVWNSQMGLLVAVEAAVRGGLGELKGGRDGLEREMRGEKERIFGDLKGNGGYW